MWKFILAAIIVVPLIGYGVYHISNIQNLNFQNICSEGDKYYNKRYCDNIGKDAYSLPSVAALNQKKYGPILGVSWRKIGSIISSPGMKSRYSKQNAYYYIIGANNDPSYQRLVIASQVEAK